jgi:hypothetical protein
MEPPAGTFGSWHWGRHCLEHKELPASHTTCVCVFCVDLRTNSDYFTVHHWLVSFYNWDGVCLLRGTSTFCVLPTQCIYVFCVDLRTNSYYFTVQHWLVGFYNWDGVCLLRGTFYILRSAHTVYLCFVWIWEQTAIISLYSIDWLVFITETECVYCAVRTGLVFQWIRINCLHNRISPICSCSFYFYSPTPI